MVEWFAMLIYSKSQRVLPGISGWLVLALISLFSTAAIARNAQEKPMKLQIILNDKTITATLNDSQTSREFAALLPLTLQLDDYAREEKTSDLPSRLSTAGAPAGTAARKGDLAIYAPWGNLVIFYKPHGYVTGLIKLGQLDEPDALPVRPDSYTARFELLTEK
ncbi:cyclophilin-like fold protein [Pectobacterium brasiliense]|uniref:Cyclophilin-like fold protein n=1 Tax=Pectobacterium brasiliense TaxID=180957 RepID=A0AAW9H6G8_9GAMM|nr:cyclophilin-like fold protein [Pectobacterium brasiliense]MDY4376827.1 cyclophilin-like fold protein [Pectobacterium brasiliense]